MKIKTELQDMRDSLMQFEGDDKARINFLMNTVEVLLTYVDALAHDVDALLQDNERFHFSDKK